MAVNKEDFVLKSIKKHGTNFNYSDIEYINLSTPITIFCNIHQIYFSQKPTHHLKFKGCKSCSTDQRKQTCLVKFGGVSPAHSSKVQHKQKQTNLEKYGHENPFKNKDVQEKQKQTNIERYGVENVFKNKDVQEKQKQTNLIKYGVDNVRKSSTIKRKIKQTILERYGVEHHLQLPCIIKKQHQTNLEKYGTIHNKQMHMVDVLHLLEDYEWLSNQYLNLNKSAKHIAQELGIDGTTLGRYLRTAEIEIRKYHQSYISKIWLESIMKAENIYIQYEYKWNPNNNKQKSDGYCQETNTIYEFHGDYWHGNPTIYDSNVYNDVCKRTMGELYQNTINRDKHIKSLGYILIVKWENEIILEDIQ